MAKVFDGSRKRSNASTNPDRARSSRMSMARSSGTIKRLRMYDEKAKFGPNKKIVRMEDTKGNGSVESAVRIAGMAKVFPDRRWFGNTRTLTQEAMSNIKDKNATKEHNPFEVVVKQATLPDQLVRHDYQGGPQKKRRILDCEPYNAVMSRSGIVTTKKPRLNVADLSEYASAISAVGETAREQSTLLASLADEEGTGELGSEHVFSKGTSSRIWSELNKVIDSSDVVVQVLDARDPEATRCLAVEKYLKEQKKRKHMVLVLNKCDLIPTWAVAKWVEHFKKEHPVVAFKASVKKAFGKEQLSQLLRQYSCLLSDRKHVSVGFIGYPNVGKSSVINTLAGKEVCKAAPIPGETKVWQYISLTKRVYLIDCPGIVPAAMDGVDGSDNLVDREASKVFRGIVRAERVESPSTYIQQLMRKVKPSNFFKQYPNMTAFKLISEVAEDSWESATDEDAEALLTMMATRMGKLVKGGEADLEAVARILLQDFQRGRIPYFVLPPGSRENSAAPASAQSSPGKSVPSTDATDSLSECCDPEAELQETTESDVDASERDDSAEPEIASTDDVEAVVATTEIVDL